MGIEAGAVILRDWREQERSFPLRPGAFLVDDQPTTLVPPTSVPVESAGSDRATSFGQEASRRRGAAAPPGETASGSIARPAGPAQVASPHRIFVEGIHDAELIEKVWGDDLRDTAIVVEPMHGVDDLVGMVRRFAPSADRRLGILLDHLVAGSKESRIAARITDRHVLVSGHPYVDVWEGVRPHVIGLDAWPAVPRGTDWKQGVCAALGEPDPPRFWRRLLGSVRSYQDLEPGLVGAVERLLDFLVEVPAE